MSDERLVLDDGRELGYTMIGAEDGHVVFYFHGAPGSRLELLHLADRFAASGVRVVTADRPGYGASSPQPGRTLQGCVDDAVALADHLGADRFAVMGLSSGGPYAVACGALLGERVLGATVAAGATDMAWEGAADGYLDGELALMALPDEAAVVRACREQYGGDGSRFFEGEFDLGAADNEFLADESNLDGLMASMGEALAQGIDGYAHDIWLQGRPWTFDPAAVSAPTIVLHGDHDGLMPVSHSRHTASLIPGSELRIVAGHGHLSLVEEFPSVAAEMVAPAG